jgi:hypothetical protein
MRSKFAICSSCANRAAKVERPVLPRRSEADVYKAQSFIILDNV